MSEGGRVEGRGGQEARFEARFAQENTVGLCQDWDLLGEMLSPSRGVGTEEKYCFSF